MMISRDSAQKRKSVVLPQSELARFRLRNRIQELGTSGTDSLASTVNSLSQFLVDELKTPFLHGRTVEDYKELLLIKRELEDSVVKVLNNYEQSGHERVSAAKQIALNAIIEGTPRTVAYPMLEKIGSMFNQYGSGIASDIFNEAYPHVRPLTRNRMDRVLLNLASSGLVDGEGLGVLLYTIKRTRCVQGIPLRKKY